MIEDVKAIDVHGHIGKYGTLGCWTTNRKLISGNGLNKFLRLARISNIETSIVADYTGMFGDILKSNERTARLVEKYDELYQWVLINPLEPRSFDQATELIRQPKSAGIKTHSEIMNYEWQEHGEKVFELAARLQAVLAVNSGWKDDIPGDYSDLANRFPEVTLIMTYLGRSHHENMYKNDFQILAWREASVKHQNIYTDTASIKSLHGNVLEYVVREMGADFVLFGTDSPNYFAPSKRIRIDKADLTNDEKRKILRENAMRLFGRKIFKRLDMYSAPRIQGKISLGLGLHS